MADAGGNLFIADVGNHRIRRVSSDGIIDTVAGNGTSGFSGDSGPATSASLQWPGGVALDSEGNLLIADRGNHRVRKVSASGIITTVAGTGMVGFSGDGGPASAAQLNAPVGVAIDRGGNLFIAESGNARIRKVRSNGTITTVASNAGLRYPTAVAVNSAENLFIADPQCSCIRKLSPNGIITLVAGGSFGFSGDGGPATSARLWDPWGVAVDGTGNVFVADGGNTRIRKVSPSGIITTVAGDGGFDSLFSFSGDGGPAIQAELKLAVPLAPSAALRWTQRATCLLRTPVTIACAKSPQAGSSRRLRALAAVAAPERMNVCLLGMAVPRPAQHCRILPP